MSLYSDMTPSSRLGMFINEVNERASDGLSLQDFSAIFFGSLRLAIAAVDSIPVDGVERKKMVMEFAGTIFNKYADRIIPLYLYPAWLLVKPAVRLLLMSIAAGAIEAILPLVREVPK